MTIATVTVSSTRTRTSAACRTCTWTADPQLSDLSVRVVARAHADRTGHCVALLASTVTLLHRQHRQHRPGHPCGFGRAGGGLMLTLQGIGYAVQVAAALATAVGIRSYASVPRSARPAARRGSLLELAALLWTLGTILTVAPASDHPAHDNPCPGEWGIYAAVCVTALSIAGMRQRRGRSATDPAAPDASGVVHDDREASYR